MEIAVQDRYWPQGRCFGCGPANEKGLRIKSRETGQPNGELVAEWMPEVHHEAFDGVLNGGIAGALLDCHSNWAAAIHLMRSAGLEHPPCTVTSDFHVRLTRPTPTNGAILVRAHAAETVGDRVIVEATLEAGGKITATCRGTFVVVHEGHPAFHRW